jgi:hypothetical protein
MVAHQSSRAAAALIGRVGLSRWHARLTELRQLTGGSERVGRAVARRHAVEVALERLRRGQAAGVMDAAVGTLAGAAVVLGETLTGPGQKRFTEALDRALSGTGTLVGLFHLLRVAATHRAQGFEVSFAGFSEGAEFDLLIGRGGSDAEIACDVVSAEEGRDVHRAAWVRLVDAIDPDLQTWLAQHPGRYLLKLTLNQGLREEPESLAAMQERIRALIGSRRRADQDHAAILRLDPLMMAVAGEGALMSSLRREFGHEAHLAVMTGGEGVCVMAARAGREDEVADAIRRRMAEVAPQRLSGKRPGILAMLVEDTDAMEWRHLREQLEIEGAARKFLTEPAARHVVAVTCASRWELFGAPEPATDLRFRNPAHPAARSAELAGAIVSSA